MIKKRVLVEAQNDNFELWIPNIEDLLKGVKKMQEFNRVKSIRVGAGITQEKMAAELGMSVKTYKAKEDGVSDWKLTEANKFVDVVNNTTGGNYNIKDIFLD